MFYLILDATNALKRILSTLDENSELYENTKTLKYILESPLFVNLYNIQHSLKKFQLNNNELLNKIDDYKQLSNYNDNNDSVNNDLIINDCNNQNVLLHMINKREFKIVELRRLNQQQTFGFTIILIQHPNIDSNETFIFVQDVEDDSIAL